MSRSSGGFYDGEKVLLTGGSGTLGRATLLCAREEGWNAKFTIFARSESRLARLKRAFPEVTCCIGDVRDSKAVQAAVTGHDVVIHMAAMKRIPECEQWPWECVYTNVTGTENVLAACANSTVAECMVISTDKACRASTVYGASKLLTEGLMSSYAVAYPYVRYHGVRYGNVMASNGSVVQLWHEQATRGEHLTLTDPSMTRFWMSPFDAARLVVGSRRYGSGIVCVPKMSSLSIQDMAMMLYPHSEVRITGVRSNEKQHEDLIHEDEPVKDLGDVLGVCTVSQPRWFGGMKYDSLHAPRVTEEDLFRMLREAGQVDACA